MIGLLVRLPGFYCKNIWEAFVCFIVQLPQVEADILRGGCVLFSDNVATPDVSGVW